MHYLAACGANPRLLSHRVLKHLVHRRHPLKQLTVGAGVGHRRLDDAEIPLAGEGVRKRRLHPIKFRM